MGRLFAGFRARVAAHALEDIDIPATPLPNAWHFIQRIVQACRKGYPNLLSLNHRLMVAHALRNSQLISNINRKLI
ncbi:hypothetical protein FQZ97_689830 [compost metagenome]